MSDVARAAAEQAFESEGLIPETWSNGAGYEYPKHQHQYHKVLFCVSGSITFHVPSGDVVMGPGDRLDLAPGTPHSASVGANGVTCMEAAKS